MSDMATLDTYGVMTDPTTLTIQRLLPGTIDRVWAYLTQSKLRRQWLAAGEMELREGAEFTLVWRNEELGGGQRPEGFPQEQRMDSRITAIDPPRMLAFAWEGTGGVVFTLETVGEDTLLTVTHRRIEDRSVRCKVGAGWHTHLDILVMLMQGTEPAPFWDTWVRLHADYDARLPK